MVCSVSNRTSVLSDVPLAWDSFNRLAPIVTYQNADRGTCQIENGPKNALR